MQHEDISDLDVGITELFGHFKKSAFNECIF